MARIPRVLQKIFGGNSSNSGQPGSARAGTFVLSTDIEVLQALPAWENGWNDITITGDKLPCLEEDQAINYVMTTQIAYLFQEGIPEYNDETTYYENSIVREPGTYKLYGSLTDDNVGNALSDAGEWVLLIDLASSSGGLIRVSSNDTTPGYLEGKLLVSGSALSLSTQNDGADETRTITLSINALGTATLANGDLLLFEDVDDGNAQKKITALEVSALNAAAYATAAQGAKADTAVQMAVGAPVATTSGTSVTIASGISSAAKIITINFVGVSTTGTSFPLIQLNGETTGYVGKSSEMGGSTNSTGSTAGFPIRSNSGSNLIHGSLVLTLHSASTNTWAMSGTLSISNSDVTFNVSGSKALSAALSSIAITTVGGIDTYDAGAMNIVALLG
jgi:hypothetical protein